MSREPAEDEESWFRPVWETDDEASLEPPGRPRPARKPSSAPDDDHPLLTPLARAQDAVARLEARAEAASEAVAEGLRRRLSYLEASGWLRHAHVWIHPVDLALRDNGLTGSYAAADHDDRLAAELPATVAQELALDAAPADIAVNQALRLARMWRRLAELRTWRPIVGIEKLREGLQSLGCRVPEEAAIAEWLADLRSLDRGPVLIRAGRAACSWMNLYGMEHSPAGFFLAACLWRQEGSRGPIPLPFWSAREPLHHRLSLQIGLAWMAEFLECVAAAAIVGSRELQRLEEAEKKGQALGFSVRSRLPKAVDAVLRAHIVTAASLAKAIDVTPQAALGLLRQLTEAGVVREATGRASWRAYVVAT